MMLLHHSISMTSGFVLPAVTTSSTSSTGTIGDSPSSHGLQIPVVKKYMNDRPSTTTTTTFAFPKSKTTASSKEVLLDLILNQTPAGRATSSQLTQQILQQIQSMTCPTPENQVLPALAGSWELLWTAQDPSQPESQRWSNKIINPIEDQSFSNNPEGGIGIGNNNNMGRSNPFLPMGIQNLLEQLGIVSSSPTTSTTRRSTQAIDIKTRTIRNIVAIQFNNNNNNIMTPRRLFGAPTPTSTTTSKPQRRIALTVTVKFTPVQSDARRVNVKFTECRISIPSFISSSINERNQHPKRSSNNNNLEYTFPLGLIGPTGWLRTIYIDDTLRITRGHKGSVFVLSRPRRATV